MAIPRILETTRNLDTNRISLGIHSIEVTNKPIAPEYFLFKIKIMKTISAIENKIKDIARINEGRKVPG